MVKYDEAFKQNVVDAYLAGEGGFSTVAKLFGIPSPSNVERWVHAFKTFGREGLSRKKRNRHYSVQFKLDVLNYKLRTGESYQTTASAFGLHDSSIIVGWMEKWRKEGMTGLSRPKGRPSMSNKANKQNKKSKKLTREQELKKENELLRAENVYLKKLRASGINIPSRLRKQNHESSMNSEENSD
ncbi:transposase [Virgibacillus soli]|uniref:Transposase n=1 Tax=Lederbergia galactosidilytica TaxID=217031 RepID=A0A0Q9Y6A9_9BACI|nr:transposase [Lederbergia galactosidilytica]KRG15022.1 transposase [Virgibacillus soli]OAK72129.1 transposase [Lederbergia galactosidilytica]OAK72309.1 transposase [Lederbergia galactosidilytica]OAK72350.1 transposase [Lederbergia galactosidilytica]